MDCTYSAAYWVTLSLRINSPLVIGLVEPSVVAFADHNEGDSRENSMVILLPVHILASASQSRQLFIEYYLVLAFSNPIAVDEDVFWQQALILFFEVFQTRSEHFSKHLDDFFTSVVDAKVRWPLREIIVAARHHGSYTWSTVISRRRMSHIYADHHGFVLKKRAI